MRPVYLCRLPDWLALSMAEEAHTSREPLQEPPFHTNQDLDVSSKLVIYSS